MPRTPGASRSLRALRIHTNHRKDGGFTAKRPEGVVQPEGRRGRESRREIRERSDRVPRILEEPAAQRLAGRLEVATREL